MEQACQDSVGIGCGSCVHSFQLSPICGYHRLRISILLGIERLKIYVPQRYHRNREVRGPQNHRSISLSALPHLDFSRLLHTNASEKEEPCLQKGLFLFPGQEQDRGQAREHRTD